MIIEVKKDDLLKLVCECLNRIDLLEHEAYYALKCIKEHTSGNKLPFMRFKKVSDIAKTYNICVYVEPYEKIEDMYKALLIHEYDIISVEYKDIKFLNSWKNFVGFRNWLIDDYKKHLQKQFFSLKIPNEESIKSYVEGNFCNYKKVEYYENSKITNS